MDLDHPGRGAVGFCCSWVTVTTTEPHPQLMLTRFGCLKCARFFQKFPAHFRHPNLNMLGCPVATTVFATHQDIDKAHSERPRAPSIQRPSLISKIFVFFRSFDERKSSMETTTLDLWTCRARKPNFGLVLVSV